MRPDQIEWNNSGMKKTPFTKVIEFLLDAYALLKSTSGQAFRNMILIKPEIKSPWGTNPRH